MVAAASSVAVVGGGLCGLATAWHLVELGARVVIYDPACLGGVASSREGFYATASALAAGLLHPLTPKLKVAWEAEAAMAAATKLMATTGEGVVLTSTIVRPCRDVEDAESAKKAADSLGPRYLEWLDPGPAWPLGGVRLVGGRVVDVQLYMKALWAGLKAHGVEWISSRVGEPRALAHDAVVCCGGAAAAALYGRELDLDLSLVRSHSLRVRGSPDLALLRGDYVCPSADGLAVVGATRDRLPLDASVDGRADSIDLVHGRLRDAFALAGPDWEPEPVDVVAGVRLDGPRTRHGRLPFVVLKDGLVLAGGLGARGLLRHAQVGHLAARVALARDDRHVPPELNARSRRG